MAVMDPEADNVSWLRMQILAMAMILVILQGLLGSYLCYQL